jgi:hypothetical protein
VESGLTSGAMIGGVQAVITVYLHYPVLLADTLLCVEVFFTSATGVNTMNSLRSEAFF